MRRAGLMCRATYKVALQEHNAALDVAGLKFEDLTNRTLLNIYFSSVFLG